MYLHLFDVSLIKTQGFCCCHFGVRDALSYQFTLALFGIFSLMWSIGLDLNSTYYLYTCTLEQHGQILPSLRV